MAKSAASCSDSKKLGAEGGVVGEETGAPRAGVRERIVERVAAACLLWLDRPVALLLGGGDGLEVLFRLDIGAWSRPWNEKSLRIRLIKGYGRSVKTPLTFEAGQIVQSVVRQNR